jgi:hypothetical protein
MHGFMHGLAAALAAKSEIKKKTRNRGDRKRK